MACVVRQLRASKYEKLYCVVGFVKDKDVDAILSLLPREATYIFTQANSERALPAAELAERAAGTGLRGEVVPSVAAAVARARELAAEGDMIFIGGSNYVVAEAL